MLVEVIAVVGQLLDDERLDIDARVLVELQRKSRSGLDLRALPLRRDAKVSRLLG